MFDEMPEPRVVSVLPSYIFVKPSPVTSIIDQVSYPWPCLSGGRTGLCAVVMHRGRESALDTRVHALPCSAPRHRATADACVPTIELSLTPAGAPAVVCAHSTACQSSLFFPPSCEPKVEPFCYPRCILKPPQNLAVGFTLQPSSNLLLASRFHHGVHLGHLLKHLVSCPEP
jgi:hypothetical protein